jgi:hypothetical protein
MANRRRPIRSTGNKAAELNVKRTGDAYTSHIVLKQTDFGITPISIGGGMIKVKNEIDLVFNCIS